VTHQEFVQFTKKWINQVESKIKPGGSFYIFNTPRNCAFILQHLESLGYQFQNWITWNKKDGFTATKSKYLPESEAILFVTKPGASHTFNADPVRVPYESSSRIEAAKQKGILKNGKRWIPNPDGRLCPDVWLFPSARHGDKQRGKVIVAEHPTIKPLALMERIVLASSNPGDIVLDCFAGSGTTLVAAAKNGRHYVGCDINQDYVNLARKKIRQVLNENES